MFFFELIFKLSRSCYFGVRGQCRRPCCCFGVRGQCRRPCWWVRALLPCVKRKCSAQYAHGRGAAQQHQPQNSSLGAAISQLVTPSSDSISTAGRQAGRTSLTTAVSTRQFCSCAHPLAASLQQPGLIAAILRRVGLPTKGSPLRPNCQNPTF